VNRRTRPSSFISLVPKLASSTQKGEAAESEISLNATFSEVEGRADSGKFDHRVCSDLSAGRPTCGSALAIFASILASGSPDPSEQPASHPQFRNAPSP